MKYRSIAPRYSLSNIVQLVALAKRGHIVTWIIGRIGESRIILYPVLPNCRVVTILLRREEDAWQHPRPRVLAHLFS